MKRKAKILLEKATESTLLSIEHFNRPWDKGRTEAVLIFLDRGFELLMKAIILYKGSKIRESRQNETIGFNKCLRKLLSEEKCKTLTEEEALTLQIINSLRDAAQHYIIEVSESQLYIYVQSAITLFNKKIGEIFRTSLSDYLPERVLPVSTNPPKDFNQLMEIEFSEIHPLVQPGSRKQQEAKDRLRAFQIVEESLKGASSQPSEIELDNIVHKIQEGKTWGQIFPGIKSLSLNPEGRGFEIKIKLTKNEGEPVRLVHEDSPNAKVVAVKRVNELDYYSLSTSKLAEKCGLTNWKILAVIHKLKLRENEKFYKKIRIGNSEFKRFSIFALDEIKKALPNIDLDGVWEEYKSRNKNK